MSLAAIEAGKAVLCEKPLAMTSDEARQLVAAAKVKNAVNCVQHNLRYYPIVQQMRQMISGVRAKGEPAKEKADTAKDETSAG